MALYPIALKLDGRHCVVIGGGGIAERKVAALLECDAKVTVVSPEATELLSEQAASGEIVWQRKCFEENDLDGAMLVIASTDKTEVNQAVYEACQARNIWVNVVDVPEFCDFNVPATINRGDFQIAINTSGACPTFSGKIRRDLEERYGPEYGLYLELLRKYRLAVMEVVEDMQDRKVTINEFIDGPALALLAAGKTEQAEACLAKEIERLHSRKNT